MKLHLVYFAAARELAACAEEELANTFDELSLHEFVSWLGEQKPRLAPYLVRMRFAINGEFAPQDARVRDGDEVTVLPPVAGGSARVAQLAEVRDSALSIDEVIAAVRHPSAGAIAVFMGVVRDHHQGKAVLRLDYEAYRELAEKEMRRILDQLAEEQPGTRLAALHRVGELAIGDIAVVVCASSPHREAAFASCRTAIDRIKASAPIWKKEWAPDGTALWINLESDERV
jgi:molybdopterin synthase catalytic subunit/molybdopterin converting factor small subunit